MLWLLLLFAGATNVAASLSAFRLPTDLKPLEYTLEVVTELEEPNFSFSGIVWIKFECITPTKSIALHSKDLTIKDKEVKVTVAKETQDESSSSESSEEKENSIALAAVKIYQKDELISIGLNEELKKGSKYTVRIAFDGILSDEATGYYKSSYLDKESGTKRWFAVTNFHHTNARRTFPCFDEPDMKANFTLRLVHKSNLKAVSSLPLFKTVARKDKNGYVTSYFLESPPMSTYLLGFMVSDFEIQELSKIPSNIGFNIWSRKDVLSKTEFTKEVVPKFLKYYQNVSDLDYPLPKLDVAIIPKLNRWGEDSWGFITLKESDVLYDSKVPSLRKQRHAAEVIAREVADQMLENVVTTKWWSNLWLYESLGSYAGSLGVEQVFPQWGYLNDSALDIAAVVFDEDATVSAQALSKEIARSEEIKNVFSSQAINKGIYLLRMLHLSLGKSVCAGISNFLTKYFYGNAEQTDLWTEITKVVHVTKDLDSGITVKEIMDTWTSQSGYPIVTVTRDYATGTAKITQKRRLRPKPLTALTDSGKWWIPLTYTTQDSPDFSSAKPKYWIKPSDETTEIKNLDSKSWLLLNIDAAGLYRVKYDEQNWKLLTDALNSDRYTEISTMNRADLLMTAFDLAWSGEIHYSKAIPLINYLVREKEWLPWKVALKKIGDIRFILMRSALFKGSHIGGYFKDYVVQLLTPLYESDKKLTATYENYYQSELHNKMSAWTIRFEMGDIQKQALPLFVNWMETKNPDEYNPIPEGLREDIYCNSIWFEGNDRWDFLLQRYKYSQEGVDRNTIMEGLACSQDKAILRKFLELSIQEESVIRREDSFYVFGALAKHTPSFPICFEFLQSRMKEIYTYHSGKSEIIGAYMKAYFENVHTKEEFTKFEAFVTENQQYLKDTEYATELGRQAALANIRWYETNFEALNEVLKEVTTRPGGVSGKQQERISTKTLEESKKAAATSDLSKKIAAESDDSKKKKGTSDGSAKKDSSNSSSDESK